MGYDTALQKAWSELEKTAKRKKYTTQFLGDNYDVDIEKKSILSTSCNVPAKVSTAILILHYLIKKLKGLPIIKEEWISFKELPGGEGYYPAFRKRVIGPIMRKYSTKPDALFELIERFRAKKTQLADASVVLEVFEGVPLLIEFWRGDEEFGPEAKVLFDKNIKNIFCTEDVVVLSETVAHNI